MAKKDDDKKPAELDVTKPYPVPPKEIKVCPTCGPRGTTNGTSCPECGKNGS